LGTSLIFYLHSERSQRDLNIKPTGNRTALVL